MSPQAGSRSRNRRRARTPPPSLLFAALGDATRLALIGRLSSGQPASIAQLTAGFRLTRQAIAKHLGVLRRAGIVHSTRAGREKHFKLDPAPMHEMQQYLDRVSHQWDLALARLKSFVEE
jgi:DNA-binding transcriptional ArsR family regulator